MKSFYIVAIAGLLGLAVGYWALQPAHTPSELEFQNSVSQQLQNLDARDEAAMQGICDSGSVKALPSGKMAACVEDVGWKMPQTEQPK